MNLLNFPRNLSSLEKYLLFSILPENKPGYFRYRNLIDQLIVIGSGRFEGNNFILGIVDDKPDLTLPSSPVFAFGTVKIDEEVFDVIIHEYEENKIEYDVSGDLNKISNPDERADYIKTLSSWNPGEAEPFNNSPVLEYQIIKNDFILCVAPSLKKIWLHNRETSVNHIIPLTNFFNELMRVKNIRNPETALNPSHFFKNIDQFNEHDIKNAFLIYNKYMNKFKLPVQKVSIEKKKTNRKLTKLFSKDKP